MDNFVKKNNAGGITLDRATEIKTVWIWALGSVDTAEPRNRLMKTNMVTDFHKDIIVTIVLVTKQQTGNILNLHINLGMFH